MLDMGLSFIAGLGAIALTAAILYGWWQRRFYERPKLARTQVSLELDDDVIFLHHIASITEEYVYSLFLMMSGFVLGFALYLTFFYFNDFRSQPPAQNIFLATVLTTAGGLLGYVGSLDKKTVIWDSAGKAHELRLPEVERIEFIQEVTKDVWKMWK